MAAIGWYGPLIDLSKASSHIGDYVQLLVFVHRSTPIQYKVPNGREVIRTDIQVGDDTRPFFPVSIWQKQMRSMASAGDIILLQNVRISRFGDIVEARTVQHSSLQCLVRSSEMLVTKDADDAVRDCRIGITTMGKLKKVIKWVQRAGSTLYNVKLHSYQNKRQVSINWKVHEEGDSKDCFSLLEVSLLNDSCKATFYASVGEIFLPFTGKNLSESEDERMFVSTRLSIMGNNDLAEDLICTGCKICGSPLNKIGSTFEQSSLSLYCPKSSNHFHAASSIYRPFMLYVWDDSKYIPLLVRNKAAELLFGNIGAERVYSSYQGQKHCQKPNPNKVHKKVYSNARATKRNDDGGSHSAGANDSLGPNEEQQCDKNPNFYLIWLVLLKMLLQQGKNSQLKFEVTIDAGRDWESGRFEMLGVTFPCLGINTNFQKLNV
ncbi:uncharacterized protein LOC132274560 [Cornus florida]|uniref:uncharacterized protein LOC132274560 n=1 Tax=Cornus florida TaxID=4283 RepID=UPI00289716B1|nr:uncharacterized protein LOC132274560 [Cornus florida]